MMKVSINHCRLDKIILSNLQWLMDTFISNSAYNVINLNDMRIGSQISTKKAKKNFSRIRAN